MVKKRVLRSVHPCTLSMAIYLNTSDAPQQPSLALSSNTLHVSMKIHDDHLYHGSALTQIAEHHQFTAINAFRDGKKVSRSSFLINQDISIYLKYASKPVGSFKEYMFTFNKSHLDEIAEIERRAKKAFVVLVCVKDREICLISQKNLFELIELRRSEKKIKEDTYTILVTVHKGESMRAYINAPGIKKTSLGKRVVPRNRFPAEIFQESDT